MKFKQRLWACAAAGALSLAAAAGASAQSVEEGFKAWETGRHDEAVRQWRTLADRGNVDAQFALGHAYRLGRGVPQNLNLAEQWYERSARGGHREAQAMYGVILFQNGRRQEALPYIQRGAESGDPRAQYVLGTVLFNGDYLPADHPKAFALMTRSAAQGLPQAQSHLQEMERHMSAADRARGSELATAMASAPVDHEEGPPSLPQATNGRASPPRIATTDIPPSRPEPVRAAPEARPAAVGRWRIQLGAFGSEANARRAWENVRGRLPGLQPHFVPVGNLTRLQAGPLSDRPAAERSCAVVKSHGGACLTVAP